MSRTRTTEIETTSGVEYVISRAVYSDIAIVTTTTSTITLTSEFTPPASCQGAVFTPMPAGYDTWEEGGLFRGLNPACYPPEYLISRTVATGRGPITLTEFLLYSSSTISTTITQVLFSPASCPSDYTSQVQSAVEGQTYITCCPGYVTTLLMHRHPSRPNFSQRL